MCLVERAALAHYRHGSWGGAAAAGGLILTLINAARDGSSMCEAMAAIRSRSAR
jgi:hypothetical protein